jgi:hypothetical protein
LAYHLQSLTVNFNEFVQERFQRNGIVKLFVLGRIKMGDFFMLLDQSDQLPGNLLVFVELEIVVCNELRPPVWVVVKPFS